MVFYITFLRALAACLITNAHYEGIYPVDLLANGGLLGDVIFFAVSGYCLYHVRIPFIEWYGRRLYRIYPPVMTATAWFLLTGAYPAAIHSLFHWLVYPTRYHFVSSILVLYIPFYVCMKSDVLRGRLLYVMGAVGLGWLAVYFMIYDKSYYHIDSVYEPMIGFLFMESMLLGAWFRQNDVRIRNRFRLWYPAAAAGLSILYFAAKRLFSLRREYALFQNLNQVFLLALLAMIFFTFAGLDAKLEKLPSEVKRVIGTIAELTLEIYVVQYVIIDILKRKAVFPLNWLMVTFSIFMAAFVLHRMCSLFYHAVRYFYKRLTTE